ncbi:MAG: polyphenol oxidase family protein, partial [Pseudomonadota bacterium]|nr:polyphenol oxidase family protein [Pseudomonadota bacterium]
MNVEVIRADALAAVPHGFLGRRGGVSKGILAGLNVGTGSSDDAAAIAENRRRAVAAVLPGAELATVFQVHSGDAVYV